MILSCCLCVRVSPLNLGPFGNHNQIFIRSKTIYVFGNGATCLKNGMPESRERCRNKI
jgi:hypothetical protein